jgi:hypothetical protein
MKRLLLIGSIVLVLGLLIVSSTSSLFAHGTEDGLTTLANEDAWEAMHEACENGDWEAMAKATEEAHGEDFDHMPYHNENYHTGSSWGGMMGGHMGGWGSMMGW